MVSSGKRDAARHSSFSDVGHTAKRLAPPIGFRGPPTLVPIFFDVETEALAERMQQTPDMTLHLMIGMSLRDVCDLLWASEGRQAEAEKYEVHYIYPDRRGKPTLQRLGAVPRLAKGNNDSVTLSVAGMQPGDSLAVSIHAQAQAPDDKDDGDDGIAQAQAPDDKDDGDGGQATQ